MAIQKFEDLECWKSARILVKQICVLTLSEQFKSMQDLRWQLQKAALSTMNNIAEGFERETRPDFARFLGIAKGSCGEVRNMLYLADDRGYVESNTVAEMRDFSKQLSKSIKAFSKSLIKQ